MQSGNDQLSAAAFPALAAIRLHAGSAFDNDVLGGSLAALLRRFEDTKPRLALLHAATLARQCLPSPGDRLADGPLWVEWCGAANLLAERHDAPCAALFWPIVDGPYYGAVAATMVGVVHGRPFTFPGAALVEPGVYAGDESVTDHMRAGHGLPTAREATLEALASCNRQIVLLEAEYLVAGAPAPAHWVAYTCRRPVMPEGDLEALRYAMMATAVLRPEADALLSHHRPATRQVAERAADHLAEYGPAAALRLLRAVGAGNTVH
jgi:hypothetical protein